MRGDGGPATAATFRTPISIQFDPAGNLLICDIGNHRVRQVDATTGVITTVAGTGQRGPTPEGAAFATAPLNGPRSLDCDRAGNLWVVLREGNQVVQLDRHTGQAHLIAGTGKSGRTGDGGPARQATLSGPKGIAIAPDGRRLFLADTESNTIRCIDLASGLIDRIAGTGKPDGQGDGDALQCALSRPHALFVDADGTLLVSDSYHHLLRVLRPATP